MHDHFLPEAVVKNTAARGERLLARLLNKVLLLDPPADPPVNACRSCLEGSGLDVQTSLLNKHTSD